MSLNGPLRFYLFFAIIIVMVAFVLWHLVRNRSTNSNEGTFRLYSEIPLAFIYAVSYLLCTISLWVLSFSSGADSTLYAYAYFLQSYFIKIIVFLVLLRVFRIAKGRLGWHHSFLLLIPAMLLYTSETSASYFRQVNNIALSCNAIFGLVVYFTLLTQHSVRLGRTWSGILMGIYFPCLLDWLNYTSFLFDLNNNKLLFSYANQLTNVVAWILLLRAVRHFEKPQIIEDPIADQAKQVFERAVKTVRRHA